MSNKPTYSSDLTGLNRLTIDAIVGATEMIEAVHRHILMTCVKPGVPLHKPLSDAASFIYNSIRSATYKVGGGIDLLLANLIPLLDKDSEWPGREAMLAALNGVLGDYLAASDNPLTISMKLRRGGKCLTLDHASLAADGAALNGRILVLVHGLCMNDLQWLRRNHDHGTMLAKDRNWTPVYLHYNTGLHISTNGRQFADQLEALVAQWPVQVKELAILGHSMGGLVSRSACHYGAEKRHRWLAHLRKLVFLGTPHHGAPLERGGNWFHLLLSDSAFTAPFSNLGKIRSAGITDLRYGSVLDEDWEGKDRFTHSDEGHRPVPLPHKVTCYAIAATTGKQIGDLSDRLLGDGLVPLQSALGAHDDPDLNLNFSPENQWIGYDMNHLDLLNRREVYEHLLAWL